MLIYQAGSAEPGLAAAVCAECAGSAEEAVAAGEALAHRVLGGRLSAAEGRRQRSPGGQGQPNRRRF